MNELTPNEVDLLKRVEAKPELRTLFFRKVKGLKWFDALYQAGYFDIQNLPKPKAAKQEGYVNVPHWEAVDYLVKTASELSGEDAAVYVPRFLEVMSNSTAYAKEHEFGNYRVWWQFAEIISVIPTEYVSVEFIDVIDYWLGDTFERGLVVDKIGGSWLVRLLEEESDYSLALAIKLLETLYKVDFIDESDEGRTIQKAHLRFDDYLADKITKKSALLAGQKLGQKAVSIFHAKLVELLDTLAKDTWSAIWQPAIPEHIQNKHRHNPENLIINAYRESLSGFLDAYPDDASKYVAEMFESPYQTIERLAIYCVGQKFQLLRKISKCLLVEKFLRNSNYRHEIWHFYNLNYESFEQDEKESFIAIIEGLKELDEEGELLEGRTAYEQARWLAAIKDFGEREMTSYKEAVAVAKAEPDHPDFSSYMTTGWGGQKSPYSVDELNALSIEGLVETLASYKGGNSWQEPGVEGLVKAFEQLIKSSPSRFYVDLTKFLNLDIAYVHEIISAYGELWNEKASLPWNEVWGCLLDFCSIVIDDKDFWSDENAQQREAFIANRNWVVAAIGRLLEAGAKADEHAFHEKYHRTVESLIGCLLEKQEGEVVEVNTDAVSMAINSPRGHCIEALVNLTLRECRLSDQKNNKDHSSVWEHFQHYYDAELGRSKVGEYEFVTLVTNYLPNFLYMSKDWILGNLENIFDQTDYLKWLCAIQGYSYVGDVYQEVYSYLAEHGDLLKVLDDKNLKDRVGDSFVQQIAVAYINDFESLEDEHGLLRILINRKKPEELRQLTWFIWTLRNKEDTKLRNKVYDLWPLLMDLVDFSTKEGRELASNLCHWAAFVDVLDEKRKAILLSIAPYADELYNSSDLLQSIAYLSNAQPIEANEIWLKLLERSSPDFPEEEIRQILSNLVAEGDEGKRIARATISEYLKMGVSRPSVWLREIIETSVE